MTEEEKKVEQTQPQMPKQLEYANQVINSMTDNKGYNPIQTIINTAPKTHEEAQFRKAQIDRGGYTPPTPMQMSGLTEEQVKANEETQKQAKADADAKAQAEKEANEEKWAKRWAAIGDGISSIANLVAVGHGSPNMYDPSNSLHSKIKGEYDRIHALKAADAQARRKEQMDLLLKSMDIDARTKEAEATRNFNIWKVGTEEEGKNQRAKDRQAFDAEQNKQKNETTLQAAKIRGRSGGGGGGNSNEPRFYATNPNGGQLEWKDKSQAMAYMKRWLTNNGYAVPMTVFGDKYADMSAAYEDAVADLQSKQSKSTSSKSSTPTKKDNAAVTP